MRSSPDVALKVNDSESIETAESRKVVAHHTAQVSGIIEWIIKTTSSTSPIHTAGGVGYSLRLPAGWDDTSTTS
jgi:hypothetical protein